MSETFAIFETQKLMFKSIKRHFKIQTALFHDYAITLSHKHPETMPFVYRTKTICFSFINNISYLYNR